MQTDIKALLANSMAECELSSRLTNRLLAVRGWATEHPNLRGQGITQIGDQYGLITITFTAEGFPRLKTPSYLWENCDGVITLERYDWTIQPFGDWEVIPTGPESLRVLVALDKDLDGFIERHRHRLAKRQ